MSSGSQHKPSGLYYVLALVPWFLAIVAFVWILLASIRTMTAKLVRVIFPGEATVQLNHVGRQFVFYEYESHVGNRSFHTGVDLKEMHCTLVSSTTKIKIPLRTPTVHTTYTYTGQYSGYSIIDFRLESPGEYNFSCEYTHAGEGEQVVFAVGPDNTSKMVLVEIFVLFVGLGAGAVAIAWVYRKRNFFHDSSGFRPSTRRDANS